MLYYEHAFAAQIQSACGLRERFTFGTRCSVYLVVKDGINVLVTVYLNSVNVIRKRIQNYILTVYIKLFLLVSLSFIHKH